MDRAESAEKADAAEPMENADANDPTEPIDRHEPMQPMERIEPFEPIDRNESCDQSDHRDREDDSLVMRRPRRSATRWVRPRGGARLDPRTGCRSRSPSRRRCATRAPQRAPRRRPSSRTGFEESSPTVSLPFVPTRRGFRQRTRCTRYAACVSTATWVPGGRSGRSSGAGSAVHVE